MSFNAIRENKILAKISGFTVSSYRCSHGLKDHGNTDQIDSYALLGVSNFRVVT